MIPIKLQMILIIFSLIGVIYIVNMIKKYRLELKYSLLWLFLICLLFILAMFPNLFNYISVIIQIEKPSNALFLFGIISILLINFSLTVALSRTSNKIKELTQELGIVKKQLENFQKKI
jgi:hypothetical protein